MWEGELLLPAAWIDKVSHATRSKSAATASGGSPCDVASLTVPGITAMEVAAMPRCGMGFELDGSSKLETRSLKT